MEVLNELQVYDKHIESGKKLGSKDWEEVYILADIYCKLHKLEETPSNMPHSHNPTKVY